MGMDWREVDVRLRKLGCPLCKGAGVVEAGFTVQVDPERMVATITNQKYRPCVCAEGGLSIVDASSGGLSVVKESIYKPKDPWLKRLELSIWAPFVVTWVCIAVLGLVFIMGD